MNDSPKAPRRFLVKRAIMAINAWPSDTIRRTEDGGLELIRRLPDGAGVVLDFALMRGDAREEEV